MAGVLFFTFPQPTDIQQQSEAAEAAEAVKRKNAGNGQTMWPGHWNESNKALKTYQSTNSG